MKEQIPKKRLIKKNIGNPPIVDQLEYFKNKSSDKVRMVSEFSHLIEIVLCFDQHYYERLQYGDNDGFRNGIDKESIEKLVTKPIKLLFLFSANVNGFSFLNHNPLSFRAVRIILKTPRNGTMLNVAIETHHLEINKYEITVKTAMCVDDFKLSDGQYSIEVGDGYSNLYKFVKKTNELICSF